MLLRRLLIAINLVLRFLSKPAALAIAAFPFIVWFVKRLFLDRTAVHKDWVLLLAVYAVLSVGLLGWKMREADKVLAREPELRAEIESLDPHERSELMRLLRSNEASVGPPVFDRIASKTKFIYRDVTGVWRIEREYRWFLIEWEKKSGK